MVQEYDNIVPTNYGKYANDKEVAREVFEELEELVNEDTWDFMRISHCKRNGRIIKVIKIQNYVGIIQLKSGRQIEILPKVFFGKDTVGDETETKEEKTKRLFLKMLHSMKDFKTFHMAHLNVKKMGLYEFFINMYLQEVRWLVKRGIKSGYENQEDNLTYCKGKILTGQHIRRNFIHKERFYVSYDEFSPNRPENRLIKAVLCKLQKLSTDERNLKEIKQLLAFFENVDASTNYEKDFSQVVIGRNTKEYEALMQWSKVFLTDKSFTTFSGKDQATAFLFPMEQVYESYVAQQVKRIFTDWNVSCQDKGKYLFKPNRFDPNGFAIRPDVVLRNKDRTIIFDTKWKKLKEKEIHYGIKQEDMYQMFAYSNIYDAREVWLLYPLNEEMKDYASPGEIYYESEDGTTVKVHFIDMADVETSLTDLKKWIEEDILLFSISGTYNSSNISCFGRPYLPEKEIYGD